MFEDRFPDKAPAKFVHVLKPYRRLNPTMHTLCGRMVTWNRTTDHAEQATCPKCAAEALILTVSVGA